MQFIHPWRVSVIFLLAAMLLTAPSAYAAAPNSLYVPYETNHGPDGNNLPEKQNVVPSKPLATLHIKHADIPSRKAHDRFYQQLNHTALAKFGRLAVYHNGRVEIVDSLSRQTLGQIFGKWQWTDLGSGKSYLPVFTYLDMVFDKDYYLNKPLIYVQVLPLREKLVSGLSHASQQTWLKRGRLSINMLSEPGRFAILQGQNANLHLFNARRRVLEEITVFAHVGDHLKLVSPLPGDTDWAQVSDLHDTRVASASAMPTVSPAIVTNTAAGRAVVAAFGQLASAWRKLDAAGVNKAIGKLNQWLPQLNPATYPSHFRRQLEVVYNATHRFTIGYLAYFAAAIILLISFGMGRTWLLRLGIGLLLIGATWHLMGIITRGILSGRYWPIDNQYESFIAITWFAVVAGTVIMFVRKQWLFGAAAAAIGAAALMFANTLPIPSENVEPVAGILATSRILYIHVDTMLFSYGMITLGFIVSLFYLGFHYFGDGDVTGSDAIAGGMRQFTAAGLGALRTDGGAVRSREALLNDLDRAQLVLLQLAFWLLGAGILLGAYWADHAWGRWWGWDPKETWALATWIIYLIAVHARHGVKRRGLVTAWLSVVGFIVMLWTYWGVNLLIPGLHSYA